MLLKASFGVDCPSPLHTRKPQNALAHELRAELNLTLGLIHVVGGREFFSICTRTLLVDHVLGLAMCNVDATGGVAQAMLLIILYCKSKVEWMASELVLFFFWRRSFRGQGRESSSAPISLATNVDSSI